MKQKAISTQSLGSEPCSLPKDLAPVLCASLSQQVKFAAFNRERKYMNVKFSKDTHCYRELHGITENKLHTDKGTTKGSN